MNFERVHDSASMRDHHYAGFLMTHVHFLQNARKKGISVAWSEFGGRTQKEQNKSSFMQRNTMGSQMKIFNRDSDK